MVILLSILQQFCPENDLRAILFRKNDLRFFCRENVLHVFICHENELRAVFVAYTI